MELPVGIQVLLQQLDEQFMRIAEMVEDLRAWADEAGKPIEFMVAVTLGGEPVVGLAQRTGHDDQHIMLLEGGDEYEK